MERVTRRIYMGFLKKFGNFLFLFLIVGVGGYFAAYNLDYIEVTIPHSGQFRMRAAGVYILVFLAGVAITVFYFGLEALKNSIILATKNHRIKSLEKKLKKLEALLRGTPIPEDDTLAIKEHSKQPPL
jgi:hypothetical protein